MKSKKRLKMHVAINLQFTILIFSKAIPTTVLSKRKREREKKKEIILKDTKITFHLPSPLSPLTFLYSCKYKKKGK